MRVLKTADGEVLDVAFSPDCRAVAAAVEGAGIFLWNLDSPNIAPVRLEVEAPDLPGLGKRDLQKALLAPGHAFWQFVHGRPASFRNLRIGLEAVEGLDHRIRWIEYRGIHHAWLAGEPTGLATHYGSCRLRGQ